jgi:hypothetical protein
MKNNLKHLVVAGVLTCRPRNPTSGILDFVAVPSLVCASSARCLVRFCHKMVACRIGMVNPATKLLKSHSVSGTFADAMCFCYSEGLYHGAMLHVLISLAYTK